MNIGPKRTANRILIDKDNHRRVLVAFGGYTRDNLYLTEDGGSTWRDISGKLPEVPIRGLARHPKYPQWLYAGTEVGLYTSENGGKSWSTKNDGPGTVSIKELVWVGIDTLLAATHGRGIFRAKVVGGDATGRNVSAGNGTQPPQPVRRQAPKMRPKMLCSANDMLRGARGC